MTRLFIFAIGGTGARVLKSLTMLLAAGIKPDSPTEFEIVPIIIDPHKENDDLKRTERLLGNYQAIVNQIGTSNGFFGTKITTLNKLVASETRLSETFSFNLQEVAGTKFKDYVDVGNLSAASKALADILFSGKSINKRGETVDLLDIEMDIGFIGNPNVGSIVLNQFKDSGEFKEFASIFNEGDRIFIISSIFGGTGAAGFPTVLKNIRNAMQIPGIHGRDFLQNAKIGALTALPYFNVEADEKSPIQKSDFIAKAKSALYYYKDNVTGNNSVNALYYIGDDYSGTPYENDPGEGGQQNNAHFVELAAALAVFDFLETPDADLQSVEGKAINPIYKQFSIKTDGDDLDFSNFEIGTEEKISLRLSQFALFKKYLDEHLAETSEGEPFRTGDHELNRQFFNRSFYTTNIAEFLTAFGDWLREMSENRRGFSPFNLNSQEIKMLIKNKPASEGFLRKANYRYYIDRLNKQAHGETYVSDQQKFINLFFETTREILIDKRFGLKEKN